MRHGKSVQAFEFFNAAECNDARTRGQPPHDDRQAACGGKKRTRRSMKATEVESNATTVKGKATEVEGKATMVEGKATIVEGKAATVEGKATTVESCLRNAVIRRAFHLVSATSIRTCETWRRMHVPFHRREGASPQWSRVFGPRRATNPCRHGSRHHRTLPLRSGKEPSFRNRPICLHRPTPFVRAPATFPRKRPTFRQSRITFVRIANTYPETRLTSDSLSRRNVQGHSTSSDI